MPKNVVISGVGRSAVGRKLGIGGLKLAVDSIVDALADAGLSVKDIDGLSTWPGQNLQMKGMALPDLYPFLLSSRVIDKLSFVHVLMLVREAALRKTA